jgi:hypothetical protein
MVSGSEYTALLMAPSEDTWHRRAGASVSMC